MNKTRRVQTGGSCSFCTVIYAAETVICAKRAVFSPSLCYTPKRISDEMNPKIWIKEETMKSKTTGLARGLAVLLASLFVLSMFATSIAGTWAGKINTFLGTSS